MIKKIITSFICIISYLGFSQNKEYPLNHISTSQGLSQSSVIAIHQDHLGQMWFGTRDGLNKYDGNSFIIYRNNDTKTAISNNDILSILEDENGFIWVGTYNGLNKYNPKKDTFTTFFHKNDKNSLSNNTVWTINEIDDEIWLGTSNGLSIYNKKTENFTNIYASNKNDTSLVGNKILSIFKDKKGNIWIGTEVGLSKLIAIENNNYQFKNYTSYAATKNIEVQEIIENIDGTIIIGTKKNGLLKLNSNTNLIEKLLPNDTKIAKDVRKLVFDDEGSLWIGTYDGLFILKENNELITLKNNNNNPKSLSKNTIKSLFKDKKGTIWIGAYYGGLNIWDAANINFKNFSETTIPKGLSYNVVSAIEKYKNELFFATEGNGLTILNTENDAVKYLNIDANPFLLDNNLKCLLVENNTLWIGTFNNGIVKYNLIKNTIEEDKIAEILKPYLKNTSVYSIKKDAKGNLFFGTFGQGVYKYDATTFKVSFLKNIYKNTNSLSSNLVRTLTIDSKNNVWIGTQKGLNKLKSNQEIERYFYNDKTQSGDDIATIFEDVEQQIWVGTKSKGLFKLIENNFIKVDLIGKNGLISTIHSIQEDNDKNLWVSTNEGILKYNIQENKTIIYNQIDGLVSNEFNDNASLKINNFEFYFGGPNGVTSFNTSSFKKNEYSPQVLISDFKVKNESLKPSEKNSIINETIFYTKDIHLNYDEGNFSIQFAIPNFINSKNNSYQYRLKGIDNDWIVTNENSASYTIQKPGNYIFEVKGANNNGLWNQEATNLNIHVKAAPWLSWWAFVIYGCIIFTSLYFLISIQKSRAKLKLDLQFEHNENQRIEEANKAKLEFFTNISHEFRTPLTLILGPLHQILENYKGSSVMYKKLLVVENSAKHLLHLINRLMDFRKLEKNLFKLEAAEGNIVKFLHEIFLSFSEHAKDGDYQYNFTTSNDEILVYYDRYKLERVFYNLISNAFRYTPKGGKIDFIITQENDKINISVKDSGIGVSKENQEKIFDRFFEINTNKNTENYNKGTGIGLSIAKNVVKMHKGFIGIKNSSENQGSEFYVTLFLGKNHLNDDEIIKDFKFSDDVSQYTKQLNQPTFIPEDELKDTLIDTEKETILLVEDNKPLRKFMKNLLKDTYNILEAENGNVALKMAIKNQPNLIVSDVMMPIMVGTELCAAIKNDLKTSHIPVILLTSRTSLIYKLDGLEKGADDYISKPFDVNEFKLRIYNILQANNRLKEKFSGENKVLFNDIEVSSIDEKLYKKALEIVENNISNENFDIPFFCSELGVSRTMLFIKIKAWTNFTPNDFIQHFRMKRAAQLLEQGKINIAEVSYKVGFKNPKYFSKCFLKKYGETPSSYSSKFSDY